MNWTRLQLLAALNLYHRTPFGKQHSTHPPVIELAELIGRTPGAVAMKLNNFTSLDPTELARGIKGLTGASKADREIWAEFESRINELADESEAALEGFTSESNKDRAALPRIESPEGPAQPTGPSETPVTIKGRRQQTFFRKTVLASYGYRCCLTGNPVPELLRASHIVPWSESEEHRANPRNGLCLAATYDAAFDRGLIAFDEDFRLLLSPRILEFIPNAELESTFVELAGTPLKLPEKNLPDSALLALHRNVIDF